MNLRMRKPLTTALMLCLVGASLGPVSLLSGCAGSGATPAAPSRSRATTTLTWPSPSRLIPVAARSITVAFFQGSTQVASQTVARPAESNQTTLSFENLPTGGLTVTAMAYPTTDGTGVAQASATKSITILAGQTVPLTITMGATLNHLTVTPLTPTVAVGQTQALSVSAVDAAGNLLLVAPSQLTWVSLTPTLASVSASGVVSGLVAGVAVIRVTDTESGRTTTVPVTVTVGTQA